MRFVCIFIYLFLSLNFIVISKLVVLCYNIIYVFNLGALHEISFRFYAAIKINLKFNTHFKR